MKWWLSVFFLIDGNWVAGSAIEGWSPRPYETEAHCLEHKRIGETECRTHPLDFEAIWVCTYGEPPAKPPVSSLPAVEC